MEGKLVAPRAGEDLANFEKGRIKALQEERLHIQKKTFTKWMNSFLTKARMEVEDLFTDLADGRKLLKLLEIISGEKLGKPNNGKMRVHKIENVNKSLAFLHTKVRLESIGAEDIVDGNPRLILGLIWTIILRFQIQEIEIDVDEDNSESTEKKSAKDALLLWCQRKTNGYSNVSIHDFTGSWRSGLGFNALIHAHRPDLIDYDNLVPSKHIDNLNHAFDVAEEQLGIPRLLDAEDIDMNKPDEKSILTYVASYYHTFARMKNEIKGGRRIANIVGQIMTADNLKYKYEKLTTNLLNWINETINKLNSRNFPNSLDQIQKELTQFKNYRTVEKPPKYKEKSEIEANYFNINIRLKELNQSSYNPPDGKLLQDIEKAWQNLEKSEYKRETALRDELIRQTNLAQLAYRFQRKSDLREGYLKDMIQVLSDPRYGINLAQVEATMKKHEAISADIYAREERCLQLKTMADYLYNQDYNQKIIINNRAAEIIKTWDELIALLSNHKLNLANYSNLVSIFREIDTINGTIIEINFHSDNVGLHLLAVEDLLQKHALIESMISSMGLSIDKLTKTSEKYKNLKEFSLLEDKLTKLDRNYADLVNNCKLRRSKLEDSRSYYVFIQDIEEEEAWIYEKQRICKARIKAKDLRGVDSLKQKLKNLIDEMRGRSNKENKIIEQAEVLINLPVLVGGDHNNGERGAVKSRVDKLKKGLAELRELVKQREIVLNRVGDAFQFHSDANEVESWINEKRPLVESTDYGEDSNTAQALLQRHKDLIDEISAYQVDINGINSQGARIGDANVNDVQNGTAGGDEANEMDQEMESVVQQKLVPQDYYEDEVEERTEYKTVTEERAVPQVKAMYPFDGQDISVAKGEVMFLLNKTNKDWWNVRKASGQDGFVPANYIKEIEPKVVLVQVRKPEVIKESKRVKKTKMVLQNVVITTKPMLIKKESVVVMPISLRVKKINTDYDSVSKSSQDRLKNLLESIKYQSYMSECSDFEKWISEKTILLNEQNEKNIIEGKKQFEKFLTDLSASQNRKNHLEKIAMEINLNKEKVVNKQNKINKAFENLIKLKQQKERSLEGASSVELFNKNCLELVDWMSEKSTQIDADLIGNDLKTVQALQRKHKNLERELQPIEEKVERVRLLAADVIQAYPNEKENVLEKQENFESIWLKLNEKALQRRNRLEDAVGETIFNNSIKNLHFWMSEIASKMAKTKISDVLTAENALKNHADLLIEIQNKEDEFEQIVELGNSLTKRNPEINAKIINLNNARSNLHGNWQDHGSYLQQCLDLQMFLKESDNIDRQSEEHINYLAKPDLGRNLDEIESMLKTFSDFENSLSAQDDKINNYNTMATKLIEADHYEKNNIDKRRLSVLDKRANVKNLAKTRKNELLKSLKFHEFKTDNLDFLNWIKEKKQTAIDENYKDLNNINKKLKKHDAFSGELRANEVRLKSINRQGDKLKNDDVARQPEIEQLLINLNKEWEELNELSNIKSKKLQQAEMQQNYYKNIDNFNSKLDELENKLNSKEFGTDRRAVKELLKKHNLIEQDMQNCRNKINELNKLGQEMKNDGHFGHDNILSKANELNDKLDNLKGPSEKRRTALEQLLKYYDYLYEIDIELAWIEEKSALVKQDNLPIDLHSAQILYKKCTKLIEEINLHEIVVKNVINNGVELAKTHPESVKISKASANLEKNWTELLKNAKSRENRLNLSLKAHEFYNDSNEIETFLTEKQNFLTVAVTTNDIHSSIKQLTKHKALELELDTYTGLVSEMGRLSNKFNKDNHPDKVNIQDKQEKNEKLLKNIKKLANERRAMLLNSMTKHEYYNEAGEFKKWIGEIVNVASSEDFGVDYEHLILLQLKFEEVKLKVNGGSVRFEHLCAMVDKIEENSDLLNDLEQVRSLEAIKSLHDEITDLWSNLLQHMSARDMKLKAAGEIHRFNRDIADALARIQEKVNEIPEGVGRDVNSCESMLRLHESFENDLVPIEAQLQVLVDDSITLSQNYPTNAGNILQEQKLVVSNWTDLQNRTVQKKSDLLKSLDYHRFLSQYRDLSNYTINLTKTLSKKEPARDTATAQLLINENDRIKSEIEARESNFRDLFTSGDAMISEQNNAEEITQKLEKLKQDREQLLITWNNKKVYLDQLIDLQIFLRDCKMLETISNTQTNSLNKSNHGNSVEEVDQTLKKHEALEKLIITQEDKYLSLNEVGSKLLNQKHFESESISNRLKEVNDQRENVKNLSNKKRDEIEQELKLKKFNRNVSEALLWIQEKLKKLQLDSTISSENLEDKIKKLKKHQAFVAELNSNESIINSIVTSSENLVTMETDQVIELKRQWNNLLDLSKKFSLGLEEAQDILDFNNQIDKTDQWIREKELLIQSGELGKDYEHCQDLIKRLSDVNSDMRVDDKRIKSINALAEKLKSPIVTEKINRLNDKWSKLKDEIVAYRCKLDEALLIHSFNRDADETNERISEKLPLVNIEDLGQDLDSVELLIRKQDVIETEMGVISDKINKLEADKDKDKADKLDKVKKNWQMLSKSCLNRRNNLTDALTYQKHLNKLKLIEVFVETMVTRLNTDNLPNTISESEELLAQLAEIKSEIATKKSMFDDLKSELTKDMEKSSYKNELKNCLKTLEKLETKINNSLINREEKLKESSELQKFNDLKDTSENILNDAEAFLNNDDLGESLIAVENLIKKHNENLTLLNKAEAKTEIVNEFGRKLIENDQIGPEIKSKLEKLKNRLEIVKKSYRKRSKILEQSKNLQKLLQKCTSLENWIYEKITIATDKNYLDLTNLNSKIQKQIAFESEIAANLPRFESLLKEENDFATNLINNKLHELKLLWEQLINASNLKRDRLNESYQALLFNQNLEDLENYFDEVEQQLTTNDHGDNSSQVSYLIKKLVAIEANYKSKKEQVSNVKKTLKQFQKANHFMLEDIEQRVASVTERYESLREPISIRKENLEEALKLYQFLTDLQEELSWIRDLLPSASSGDLGNSLNQVNNLIKKHSLIENELKTHEPIIKNLAERNSFSSSTKITDSVSELLEQFQLLGNEVATRKANLHSNLKSQTYINDVNECVNWLNERKHYFTNTDYGKDEESVLLLLKKLELNQRDLHNYGNTIEKLTSKTDFNSYHGDMNNKKSELKELYSELQKLSDKRGNKLRDALKLFKYEMLIEELIEWIEMQMHTASSEDYGRDVEHVEILIQKFETFLNSVLNDGENRLQTVLDLGNNLKEEGHPESEKIAQKSAEIAQFFEDFKELASARAEALSGAKKVHIYDRTADETISWIIEKTNLINTDYGSDLESIKELNRNQETFERDLQAVKNQVDNVKKEALDLANEFPDAKEHIDVKLEETIDCFNCLTSKFEVKKNKLKKHEELQEYFDKYRELLAFITEMIAKVTAMQLGENVKNCELLLQRHDDYRNEIDAKKGDIDDFLINGEKLVNSDHFLSSEINEKVVTIKSRSVQLEEIYRIRREIYVNSLDLQLYLRDLSNFQTWLDKNSAELAKSGEDCKNVKEAEELLAKHKDFEKKLEAHEVEKVLCVKRKTLIESGWEELKKKEGEMREAELRRVKQVEIEKIKQIEVRRITEERMRDQNRDVQDTDGVTQNKHWNIFGDRLRRGSDGALLTVPANENNSIQGIRSESFRHTPTTPQTNSDTLKKPKRTPSFTTRRRTTSFRKLTAPIHQIASYIERKQITTQGKRATIRSWKTYYTVLCGQLLCFFKDEQDFVQSKAASPPISVYKCRVEKAQDYIKKKHVFRIVLSDNSEFLFACEEEAELDKWVGCVGGVSNMEPREQLSFTENRRSQEPDKEAEPIKHVKPLPLGGGAGGEEGGDELSSNEEEEEEEQFLKPRSREPLYANLIASSVEHALNHNKNKETGVQMRKPPIPPRSSSIVVDSVDNNRPSSANSEQAYLKYQHRTLPVTTTNSTFFPQQQNISHPSFPQQMFPPPVTRVQHQQRHNIPLVDDPINNPYYHVYTAGSSSTSSRTHSLPSQQSMTTRQHQKGEESSSESDSPSTTQSQTMKKDSKRSSGLMGLFKRKKATQL